MRRRINRTLLTATAASVSVITLGFMATGAVGASTTTAGLASTTSSVTPILSQATDCVVVTTSVCAVSGYQASGRLFRYAQASIVVPNHAGSATGNSAATPQVEPDAAVYVALDDSSDTAYDYARVGIMGCNTWADSAANPPVATGLQCALPSSYSGSGVGAVTATNLSGWQTFAKVVEPSLTPATYTPVAIPVAAEGLGIFVSVYLSPTGNSVHTVTKTPATSVTSGSTTTVTPGHTYNYTFPVNGPAYSHAIAVADWTGVSSVSIVAPFQPTAGVAAGLPGTVAYTQFQDGRITTWSGTRGTFNGKWTVTPYKATVDGTSATAVVTSPGYLWSSTTGYANDAFGVWLRHL
jgi:hypothetical protein